MVTLGEEKIETKEIILLHAFLVYHVMRLSCMFVCACVHAHMYVCMYVYMYIYIYILMTCLIQHVYASACACMFTLSTASSDAPSSTSTRTVSACPLSLAHINAVLPRSCEHSQVITVQRSIALDEREHAHEYKKKMYVNTYEYTCMYIYEAVCSYIYQSIYIGVCVCVCVCSQT